MEEQLKEFLETATNEELMKLKGIIDKAYAARFRENPGEHDNEMETQI